MPISAEASPPSYSSSSHDTRNPSLKNSNPSKAKFSVPSLVAQFFKSKRISSKTKPMPKAKPLEKHHQDAASSSTYIADKSEDHHDRAHGICKMIRQDLKVMEETLAEVKKYEDNMDVQIKQAHEKFEKLITTGSSERELEEFKKAVKKLKSKIPSQLKIVPADSNPHRHSWPDINKASNETCLEPNFDDGRDFADLLKAFLKMTSLEQLRLSYFFLFPPKAVIKRRVLINLWISCCTWVNENEFDRSLREFIKRGFIEPIYQKCSLAPDSFRISLSLHSALSDEAKEWLHISKSNSGQITEFQEHPDRPCLVNIGKAIIDGQLFENRTDFRILYLGRWQSSATHHIEVVDIKVLYGLKNMKDLEFLSLQGISLITELPSFILELNSLRILDLRACHNLEVLPDGIGSLEFLTHLDMSECYFLEHMPKSLGNLSRLEVLKGFFIGDSKDNKPSCTLYDLSMLRQLRKLNIYTGMKNFPTMRHLSALQKFQSLEKLTISWGGCSFLGKNTAKRPEKLPTIAPKLPSRLEKLDLQGFHGTSLPSWLRPANLKVLKKLYIRGGRLCDLGKVEERNVKESQWTVKILRLKYSSDLKMDWRELMILFPKLIYLQIEDCPQLTGFPCDANDEWIHKKAIDQAAAIQCDANGEWIHEKAFDEISWQYR